MGAEEPLGPVRFESRQGRTIHPEGFDVGAQLFGNASQPASYPQSWGTSVSLSVVR